VSAHVKLASRDGLVDGRLVVRCRDGGREQVIRGHARRPTSNSASTRLHPDTAAAAAAKPVAGIPAVDADRITLLHVRLASTARVRRDPAASAAAAGDRGNQPQHLVKLKLNLYLKS